MKMNKQAYNTPSDFVRGIKYMRARRDILFFCLALLLSWLAATVQAYSNPNNWASFLTLSWVYWMASLVITVLAVVIAYFCYQIILKYDDKIDNLARSERKQERDTDIQIIADTVSAEIKDLRNDLRK